MDDALPQVPRLPWRLRAPPVRLCLLTILALLFAAVTGQVHATDWDAPGQPDASEQPVAPDHPAAPAQSAAPMQSVASAQSAEPKQPDAPRHFELESGDASLMLNEFSRESDLQVLFDYNILKGMKTKEVSGDLIPSDALTRMLKGTGLVFDFVNDRTLAVTPKKPTWFARLVHRLKKRPAHPHSDVDLDEVLISGTGASVAPALGGEHLVIDRLAIEQSGSATLPQFFRTVPQVFGGGPTEDTQLGREAGTNGTHGSGINMRGLDAGATVVLLNGQRLAPSGTSAGWVDISLIPITAIERIDLLADGAGAQYGSDAIGGVVNFQLRSKFSGAETQVRMGSVTDGPTKEQQFSQLLGHSWEGGNGIAAVEYYRRDALWASSRAQATSDLRPFGGTNFDSPNANPGTLLVGGQTYAIPRGQNGAGLNAASLVPGTQNFTDLWGGATVLPTERRLSALTSLRQSVGDHTTFFVDALAADRSVFSTAAGYAAVLSVPGTNPFYVNPGYTSPGSTTLGGEKPPVMVLYNFGRDLGPLTTDADVKSVNLIAGVNWEGEGDWKGQGSVGYSMEREHQTIQGYANPTALQAALADSDPATAFNPFGDGSNSSSETLDKIRTSTLYTSDSNLKLLRLHAGGPILPVPAGAAKLAVGIDYRDQVFNTEVVTIDSAVPQHSDLGRHVIAGFAELRVPIFDLDNRLPGLERLEFSTSVRHEHYSDVGGATTPQFGLSWMPAEPITVRSTWAKLFRPPTLPDRVEATNASTVLTMPDLQAPNHSTQTLLWTGNNADLAAERGRSWTLGADFKSDWAPGLTLGVTYFDIHLSSRVEETPFSYDALDDPLYAALITRDPTPAQRARVCSRSAYQGLASDCLNAPIGAIFDLRLRNAATVITRGIDFTGEYRVPHLAHLPGQLKLGLLATDLFEFSRAEFAGGPLQNLLNTENQPIDLRLRGSAAWDYRGFGIVGSLNYTDSYRQFITDSTRTIPSWTTVDLHMSYGLGDASAGSGMQIALNVDNLFNRLPPFVNNPAAVGYDQENGDLLGRLVSLTVKYRW